MRGAGWRVRQDFSHENERTTPTPQVGLCHPHGHDSRGRPAACPPEPPQPCRGVVPSIAVLRRAKEMSAALLLFYFGTICPKVEPQEWAASSRVPSVLVSPPDNGRLVQHGLCYGREVI